MKTITIYEAKIYTNEPSLEAHTRRTLSLDMALKVIDDAYKALLAHLRDREDVDHSKIVDNVFVVNTSNPKTLVEAPDIAHITYPIIGFWGPGEAGYLWRKVEFRLFSRDLEVYEEGDEVPAIVYDPTPPTFGPRNY